MEGGRDRWMVEGERMEGGSMIGEMEGESRVGGR